MNVYLLKFTKIPEIYQICHAQTINQEYNLRLTILLNTCKNHSWCVTVVTITLFLSACVSVEKTDTDRDTATVIRATAPLSVTSQEFKLNKSDPISWLPEAIKFYSDPRINKTGLKVMIENAITQEINNKGLTLRQVTSSVKYLLAYTAAMESSLDDRTILLRYGLLPGDDLTMPASQSYNKGTLIIYLVDAQTKRPVWKSALQAEVDFEVDNFTRSQRVQLAVKKMLSTLPIAR